MKNFIEKNKTKVIICAVAVILVVGIIFAVVLGGGNGPDVTNPTTSATDPTNGSTQPTGPDGPTNPTTPTGPIEPTGPSNPTNPSEPEHEHSFEATVVEPTCTEGGYTLFVCACGDSHTGNDVEAFGHDWTEWETAIEPTETAEGTLIRRCKVCGVNEEESIPVLPAGHTHAFDVKVVNPTCTEAGYTYSVCECGHIVKSDELDPLGHNFTEYVSDNNATCTEDGTKTASCTRCDEKDVITEEGTAKGHNFVESIVGPTTEEQGYTKHTCSNCGYTYKDNYVDKLPEDPEDNTTYPTEREDYPFDDITPENITTDQWDELTVEEQDELLNIWVDYYNNNGGWPPEARHNWIYATQYNSYSCGWANHVCYSEEYHYWLLAHECDTCGSTECPANYVLDPETLYTQPDGTQCPEYEERNDPSKYCQECGYPTWTQAKPGEEFCTRTTMELPCPDCGETIQPNTCHHCVKPGAKPTNVNALIPEKKKTVM